MNEFAISMANSPEWRLFAALAIGLFIGIEREHHKQSRTAAAPKGLRTFVLVALAGGLAAQTDSAVVVGLVVAFTILIALLGYWKGGRHDFGITTEVSLVVTVVLGVMAQSRPVIALGASVIVASILASRISLHRFAQKVLSENDLRDGLLLSTAALVVLPLLPNRFVDPIGLVNPFALWRLAVVLMSISAASYCAMRMFGPRFGLPISGIAGGFVSSTAAIASMGARARSDSELITPCSAGAVASSLGSLIFLVALVGAADPKILDPLVKPFALAVIASFIYAAVLTMKTKATEALPTGKSRAFDFKTAIIFAGLVAIFSLVSWSLVTWLGKAGIFISVIGTALIDAHAAAVSVANLVASGKLDSSSGAFAILIGFSVNMIAKVPTAFALGPPKFGWRVTSGLLVMIAGLWIGYFWGSF